MNGDRSGETRAELGALTPAAIVDALDRRAKKLRTPCGNGSMVWRVWGKGEPLLLFHGGSGSTLEEIREAVDYGVVKMNVDTDCQYAFTRPLADWMFVNYDGVLKVDGEVGNKKKYDPRAWGKAAEAGMTARVVEACQDLRSAGTKA